jgi:hypothetical protein
MIPKLFYFPPRWLEVKCFWLKSSGGWFANPT